MGLDLDAVRRVRRVTITRLSFTVPLVLGGSINVTTYLLRPTTTREPSSPDYRISAALAGPEGLVGHGERGILTPIFTGYAYVACAFLSLDQRTREVIAPQTFKGLARNRVKTALGSAK